GLADLPPAQPALRAQLEAEAAREGWPSMHEQLPRLDPSPAGALKPTDAQRIQRALEVYRHTGRALSALQDEGRGSAPPFETLRVALEPSDRGALHARIAARVRRS